jgi:PadR family transcriptional regulator, regulatory protein PadR
MPFQLGDVGPQRLQRPSRLVHGPNPVWREAKKPLGASASLGRGLAKLGRHEPVSFEPVQGGVDGPQQDAASTCPLNLPGDPDAIRVVPRAEGGEENHELEVGQEVACHLVTIYEQTGGVVKSACYTPPDTLMEAGMTLKKRPRAPGGDLLQGTLDMLVLQTLQLGPAHGYAISRAIEQRSEAFLQVEQGSLYPALNRLEDRGWVESSWATSENNRRARYYALTPKGRRQLQQESDQWRQIVHAIGLVMRPIE